MDLTQATRICILLLVLLDIFETSESVLARRTRRKRKRQSPFASRSSPRAAFCYQNGEGFHPNEEDCTKFIRCVEQGARSNGDPILTRFDFDCAPGTVYDPSILVCNFPDAGGTPLGCRGKYDYEIIGLESPPLQPEEIVTPPLPRTTRAPRRRTTTTTTSAPRTTTTTTTTTPEPEPETPPPPDPIEPPPPPTTTTPPPPDCNCNMNGTVSGTSDCDPGRTDCTCKKFVQGAPCDHCEDGYFNLEPENEFGCSPCFCFGHASTCHSAEGYNLVPIRSEFAKGFGKWTAQDQNGAEVAIEWTKSSQDISVTSTLENQQIYFLTPNTYLGDQLRSFNRFLHFTFYIDKESDFVLSSTEPTIIIEGAGLKISYILFGTHDHPLPKATPQNYSVKLHPDAGWEPKLSPAVFLKLFSKLTSIKIRGTHTNKGTGHLDNVYMETARKLPGGPPTGSVEECDCAPGYNGTSCEECAMGFMRSSCGGDPLTDCLPCDCTKKCPGEILTTCTCEDEPPPPPPTTTTEEPTSPETTTAAATTTTTTTEAEIPIPTTTTPPPDEPKMCNCNPIGSIPEDNCDTTTGNCICKKNVQGPSCDSCTEGHFGLDAENAEGCTECFCFEHSTKCHTAEGYNFVPVRSMFAKGYGKWTTEDANGTPIQIKWSKKSQDLTITSSSPEQQIYFVAPLSYLGDQKRSFNKFLNFSFYIDNDQDFLQAGEEDLILEGGGLKISMPIFGDAKGFHPQSSSQNYSFLIHPDAGWEPKLSKAQFMKLLSNLSALKIRGTYTEKGTGYLDNVFLETARKLPGPPVPWVEECDCAPGYSGSNCEDCADGFMREECGGDSFGKCIPCDCSKICPPSGEVHHVCRCP